MEFAVATPIVMIEPISDGTLNVVRLRYSIQRIPENAPGSAIKMMNGSSQLWKLTAISRYTMMTANPMPRNKRLNDSSIVDTSPRKSMNVPPGRFFSSLIILRI